MQKPDRMLHPRTLVAFVIETMNGITQYYRTIGNINGMHALLQASAFETPTSPLDQSVCDMLLEALDASIKLNEEQEKIALRSCDPATTRWRQMKPSEYDEYINASKGQDGNRRGKGKERRR